MRINSILIAGTLACASSLSLATPVAISCGLTSILTSHPEIHFGDIPKGLNLDDYESEGSLGVTARISGKDKVIVFARTISYKKVRKRLEIDPLSFIVVQQYTFAEIKDLFGPVPEISCTVR